jgi:hypothetical protein
MTRRPQTIQIFLPSGNPQAIRVAEIPTRIVRVIEVPRSLLGEFLAMPDAAQVGLYFLFGEDEASGSPKAYIGQTGSLATRLAQHNAGKPFWTKAVVAVSLTNNLTGTHAGYLEWTSIQAARDAARYPLENGNAGARPHVPPPLEADCREIHETIRVLMATLGYPLFEPLLSRQNALTAFNTQTQAPTKVPAVDSGRMFFATGSGADARAIYTPEGMVVLEGSTGRGEIVPSFEGHGYNRLRNQLLEQGVMVVGGGRVRLTRDYLFTAPSAAAACLMGRTANGHVEWKDASGRTLSELELQPP